MGNQQKGSNAERDLIHRFWALPGWTAVRVAGSGSMRYPAPDVLAVKEGVSLAIECKVTKNSSQYLEKREIDELKEFAKKAGARAFVAVRFFREEWRFLSPDDLNDTGVNVGVSKELAALRGLTFEELTKAL